MKSFPSNKDNCEAESTAHRTIQWTCGRNSDFVNWLVRFPTLRVGGFVPRHLSRSTAFSEIRRLNLQKENKYRKLFTRLFLLLAITSFYVVLASAQSPPPAPAKPTRVTGTPLKAQNVSTTITASKLSAKDCAEAFEKIWRTVEEKYYDPTFNGVDWKAVRERFRPRVETVQTNAEFYRLMNRDGRSAARRAHARPFATSATRPRAIRRDDHGSDCV